MHRKKVVRISPNSKESAYNVGDPGLIMGREDHLEKELATYSIFLPGEFHGQRSLAGYSPWISELDMMEQLTLYLLVCLVRDTYKLARTVKCVKHKARCLGNA